MSSQDNGLIADQNRLDELLRPTAQWPQNTNYNPLTSDNQTRVLRVRHDDSLRRLNGTLQVIDLSSKSQYDALSYYWGLPGGRRKSIHIDGEAVLISPSLYAFLRRFGAKSERNIWVDALCVNQNDVEERSQQVSIMDCIYRGAEVVHVWLGKGDSDTDFALACCQSWHQVRQLEPEKRMSPIDIGKVASSLVQVAIRPYWRRVWIVQEVALARYPSLACGNLSVPFSHFRTFVMDIVKDVYRHGHAETSRSHETTDFEGPAMRNLDRLLNSIEVLRQTPQSLLEVASKFAWHLCTDARDKIYGVRSLALDSLAVDYKKSFADILLDTVANDWKHSLRTVDGYATTSPPPYGLIHVWLQHLEWAQSLVKGIDLWSKTLLTCQSPYEQFGVRSIPFMRGLYRPRIGEMKDVNTPGPFKGIDPETVLEPDDEIIHIIANVYQFTSLYMVVLRHSGGPITGHTSIIGTFQTSSQNDGRQRPEIADRVEALFLRLFITREIQFCQRSSTSHDDLIFLHVSRRAMLAILCAYVTGEPIWQDLWTESVDAATVPEFCYCQGPELLQNCV